MIITNYIYISILKIYLKSIIVIYKILIRVKIARYLIHIKIFCCKKNRQEIVVVGFVTLNRTLNKSQA